MKSSRKILIMGLPGAGKTTLAEALMPILNAVHFNADAVRTHVHKDLGFELRDRIEHARRLGWLCEQVVRTGSFVIADFVCPTEETRTAFGEAFVVWVDRIKRSRFEDTNILFQCPTRYDIRVTRKGSPEYWAELIASVVKPVFNSKQPTALFVGRYQPFHAGHKALIEEGIRRVGQACIAVRDTGGIDENNPYSFELIRARIEEGLREHRGRFTVMQIPNISAIYYGREVGYIVERIELDPEIEKLSGSDFRRRIGKSGPMQKADGALVDTQGRRISLPRAPLRRPRHFSG
jgi:hypothetical protein